MAELPPAPELPQPAAIPVAPDLAPFAAPTPGETAQAPAPISGKLDVPVPEPDAGGRLAVPVAGMGREDLSDTYNDMRGSVRHEALDVMAPTGTPVVAVDDGVIRKQFISKKGGLTLYQFDSQEKLCYYYAHLDRYADGMAEGKQVRRGEVIGYVGTSGNAKSPHLHFSVTRLGLDKKWWQGEPINPYPLIMGGR